MCTGSGLWTGGIVRADLGLHTSEDPLGVRPGIILSSLGKYDRMWHAQLPTRCFHPLPDPIPSSICLCCLLTSNGWRFCQLLPAVWVFLASVLLLTDYRKAGRPGQEQTTRRSPSYPMDRIGLAVPCLLHIISDTPVWSCELNFGYNHSNESIRKCSFGIISRKRYRDNVFGTCPPVPIETQKPRHS